MTFQIGIIVGSLRKDSFNLQLAKNLVEYFPDPFKLEIIQIGQLPLYNQDLDTSQPESVLDFKAKLESKHGIIFVTPEHNRSIPAALKNALDHGTRPWGNNSWNKKPACVIGTSKGSLGAALAQSHLRSILTMLNMPTMQQPDVFLQWNDDILQEDGKFVERTDKYLRSWAESTTSFFVSALRTDN